MTEWVSPPRKISWDPENLLVVGDAIHPPSRALGRTYSDKFKNVDGLNQKKAKSDGWFRWARTRGTTTNASTSQSVTTYVGRSSQRCSDICFYCKLQILCHWFIKQKLYSSVQNSNWVWLRWQDIYHKGVWTILKVMWIFVERLCEQLIKKCVNNVIFMLTFDKKVCEQCYYIY